MATSPDLNGDGIGDVLLGAPGVDRPSGPTLAPAPNSVGPQESIGAAYVVYGSKTPSNVSLGTLTGKGQLLMGGGGFRWGDQAGWSVAGLGDLSNTGVNVAAVGVPGWDSNQQTPVGTGRDRGQALLLNGVTDPIAPTISITSPLDGAQIPQGTPVALAFSCDDDQTVVSCTATDRGVAIANGANLPTAPGPGRPAHGHGDREGRSRQHDDQERHVQRGRDCFDHAGWDGPGDAVAVAGLGECRPRPAHSGHRGGVQRDHHGERDLDGGQRRAVGGRSAPARASSSTARSRCRRRCRSGPTRRRSRRWGPAR